MKLFLAIIVAALALVIGLYLWSNIPPEINQRRNPSPPQEDDSISRQRNEET